MKVSEFKKAINNIDLQYGMNLEVKVYNNVPYIVSGDDFYACVSKTQRYVLDTNYLQFSRLKEDIREDLLKVMYEFARTPIEEREDEKRYIIPLPHLTTSDGEQQYLSHQGTFFASRRDKELRQIWKEEHLKHIPEEYRKYAVEVKYEI